MRQPSSVDAGRLSALVSRPGIDPRTWVSRAKVTELGFDPEKGLFADITYLPDGETDTALIGSGYVGDGFGGYVPLKTGDLIAVVTPQGDPGEGPIIISRLWHAGAKPPIELAENDSPTTDEPTSMPTFRLEDGNTVRVIARQSGAVKIELSGGSTFEVVATGGSRVVISADTTVEITGSAKVNIASSANVTLDAPLMKIGESATLGIARVNDPTVAGSGAAAMLSSLAASATADATSWGALAGTFPAVAPSAAAATALASAASAAAAQWGRISLGSLKGFCS